MEQRFLKQIAKTSNLGAQKKYVLVIEIILEKNMDCAWAQIQKL